jgi:hypothetical protein
LLLRLFPGFPSQLNRIRLRRASARLAQSHGHDDIEERAVDLQHAGTQFVNQLDEHFVVIQRVERVYDVFWVEGDGEVLALVIDGLAFLGFAGFDFQRRFEFWKASAFCPRPASALPRLYQALG